MNLVITLSRRFGTGASMISEELSKKLEKITLFYQTHKPENGI